MGKATIIEAQNSNTVYEDGKAKGILGKLKGIFADYKHGTRNSDRLYTEELWDNRVFGSEDVMEALETKTLFGELDHPEGDRNETLAQNAAISITKLEKKPEEGVIYGEADILDTPTGRIVKALADSGAQLGISSRGLGEEVYREGKNIIDPDTYDFITFDVVVTPANRKARVSLAESKQDDVLSKTITDEISKSETINQLNQIKTVVESVPTSNKENLLKLIESKDDILTNKQVNRSRLNEANKTIALKLINAKYESTKLELEEAKKQSKSHIEESLKLIEEREYLSNSKRELKRKLKESILSNRNKDKEIDVLKTKTDNVLQENENLNTTINKLNESLTKQTNVNNATAQTLQSKELKIKDLMAEMNSMQVQIQKLNKDALNLKESYNNKLKEKDAKIKELTESINKNNKKLEESKQVQQNEISKLQEQVNQLTAKCNTLTKSNSKYEKLSFEPMGTVSLLNESFEINNNISEEDKDLYNLLVNMYENK